MVDTNDRTEVFIDPGLDPNVSVPGITVRLVPDQRDCRIGGRCPELEGACFGFSCRT